MVDAVQADQTPEARLCAVAEKGDAAALRRFLAENPGVDVDAPASMGMTPLALAVMSKNAETVKVLLDAGAKPDAMTGLTQTPLLIAVGNGI